MSTAKRSHQRQSESDVVAAAIPPAKKQKLSNGVKTKIGFEALVDDSSRQNKVIRATPSKNVKDTAPNRHDEANVAVVSNLDVAQDVDMHDKVMSDSSSVSDTAEESEVDEQLRQEAVGAASGSQTNGILSHTSELVKDQDIVDAEHAEDEPPSFGEMLQAKYPGTIEVQAAFAEQARRSTALVLADNSRNLQAPPATSLGTVLTQALKTNDKELLESCLQMHDIASIRSTIQRLQSPLVATLMTRVAERLYKRPGRATSLMHWIQWSLVAHGGYLASQPELVTRLKALSQVVRERANSLQPLLMLKGKLDLLGAQVELRRNTANSQRKQIYDEEDDDLLREDIIYIEGQDDSDSEQEVAAISSIPRPSRRTKRQSRTNGEADSHDDDEDSDIMQSTTAAFIDNEAEEDSGSDDQEESSGSEDNETASSADDLNDVSDDDDVSDGSDNSLPDPAPTEQIKRSAMIKRRR